MEIEPVFLQNVSLTDERKAQQIAVLPTSTHESMDAVKVFRRMFIEKLYTQMKLSTESLIEEVHSVDSETDELDSMQNDLLM